MDSEPATGQTSDSDVQTSTTGNPDDEENKLWRKTDHCDSWKDKTSHEGSCDNDNLPQIVVELTDVKINGSDKNKSEATSDYDNGVDTAPDDAASTTDPLVVNGNHADTDADTHQTLDDDDGHEYQLKKKAPDGGYGWFVVLGCFISHIIMGCLERSDGIYFLQFQKRYGLSAQLTAWPGALVTASRLVLGPVAGELSNRFSVRTTCLVGSCILFIGIFLNGFSPNFYFLFLSHFLIQGIGRGLVYAPGLVIVGMYFDKKRSLATGLSASGVGVGTFLFVPVTQMLFDTYGFRGAFIVIAAISLHTAVSSMLYRPLSRHYKFTTGREEKNADDISLEERLYLASTVDASDAQSIRSWRVYHTSMHNVNTIGDDTDTNLKQIKERNNASPLTKAKKDGWLKSSLKICFPVEKHNRNNTKKGKLFNVQLLKNPAFFLFCMSILLFTAAFKSAFTFIPALVKSLDFSDSQAAFVLSIVGIVDTAGRVALGFLFDRSFVRKLRPIFFTSFLFCIAAVSFILPSLTSYASICVACGVYGCLTGAYVSQKAVVNVDILGVAHIASSFGLLICFQGIGACMGPPLVGALRDATGSFQLSFYLGGFLMLCAGCLMVASNVCLRRQRQAEKNSSATSVVIQ